MQSDVFQSMLPGPLVIPGLGFKDMNAFRDAACDAREAVIADLDRLSSEFGDTISEYISSGAAVFKRSQEDHLREYRKAAPTLWITGFLASAVLIFVASLAMSSEENNFQTTGIIMILTFGFMNALSYPWGLTRPGTTKSDGKAALKARDIWALGDTAIFVGAASSPSYPVFYSNIAAVRRTSDNGLARLALIDEQGKTLAVLDDPVAKGLDLVGMARLIFDHRASR